MAEISVKHEGGEFTEYLQGQLFNAKDGVTHNPTVEQKEEQGYFAPVSPLVDEYTEKYEGYSLDGDIICLVVVTQSPEELAASLARVKAEKSIAIAAAFYQAESTPLEVSGVEYWASIESAMRLDGARRMVEEGGGTSVNFTDIDREPHNLVLQSALNVCLQLGAKAQSDFQNRQAKLVEVEKAKTAAEVLNITW